MLLRKAIVINFEPTKAGHEFIEVLFRFLFIIIRCLHDSGPYVETQDTI
jgi:hypothetical protein